MTFIYTPPEPTDFIAKVTLLPGHETREIKFEGYTEAQLHSEVERVRRECLAILLSVTDAAYRLAEKELARLNEENFGRIPNDAWANAVLNLRDTMDLLK